MALDPTRLPDDVATLRALLVAEHAARIASDTRASAAEARARGLDAEIANLKLTIAKMKRQAFGASSERSERLLDQLELQLAELVERKAEEKTAAEIATPPSVSEPEESRKPARRSLPKHLPRERLVHAAPSVCPCCSGTKFRTLGEGEVGKAGMDRTRAGPAERRKRWSACRRTGR